MPEPLAVAVSGSPRSPSKSRLLAELTLEALARAGWRTRLIDLSALDAEALLVRREDAAVAEAIAAVREARIVVAATPTYRALYTGLLKCFFDLMPQGHLAGKVCLPLQTAGVADHALAVEYGLRPLFASLGGLPLAGVYATDVQFPDGAPDADLVARLERAAAQAARVANAP